MPLKRLEIKITGTVQGVFFRQNAKEKAEKLGLTGWAKNEKDGSVKIVAEGEEENLRKFAAFCEKNPGWSRVEKTETEWKEAKKEFSGFKII